MWKQIQHCVKYLNTHTHDVTGAYNTLLGPGVERINQEINLVVLLYYKKQLYQVKLFIGLFFSQSLPINAELTEND